MNLRVVFTKCDFLSHVHISTINVTYNILIDYDQIRDPEAEQDYD